MQHDHTAEVSSEEFVRIWKQIRAAREGHARFEDWFSPRVWTTRIHWLREFSEAAHLIESIHMAEVDAMSIRKTDDGFLVTITVWFRGTKLVGFSGGATFPDALANTAEALSTKGVRWRKARY